jgi:membrane protease subunit (stomatin/prohibitin family)
MGLFGKNTSRETGGGKQKHWINVIKNSGPGELLLWRQPEEDFNTNSTLIVMPGEEAIFIKSGNVEQVFESGTYILSTENYPFISRLRNAFSGGVSTFNCVVYFVRKSHSAEILWGTDSPIQVRDKILGIATKLRSRGAYKIQIDNPAKFLEKLIGNNILIQTQQELNKYFINEFQSKIKSKIARALNETNTELLGIDARLEEFSDILQPYVEEIFEEYGLRCIKFTIAAIDLDDDELRRRYDEIGMNAVAKIRNAQADKNVMGILGDDWGRQQAANILGNLSVNPGAGGIAAAGAGMGMGISAGGAFGAMTQQMFTPMTNGFSQHAEDSVRNVTSERFMQEGTVSTQENKEDPIEILGKLKQMLDVGLIDQAEYDEKKAEVLSRM